MPKFKLLITGDSFAADWTVKYKDSIGWPNMLAKEYSVTNLAQAGCSEYKIYLQLISKKLEKYDGIIVSHTSPNRIYVKDHPVHNNDTLHKNSDLIYTDLKNHAISNKELLPIIDFYENYFDVDYAKFVHRLICREIDIYTTKTNKPVLHITNIAWDGYEFKNMLDFSSLFKTHRGDNNHYDSHGNIVIFDTVKKWIEKLRGN